MNDFAKQMCFNHIALVYAYVYMNVYDAFLGIFSKKVLHDSNCGYWKSLSIYGQHGKRRNAFQVTYLWSYCRGHSEQ